jgi:hypothetical protein
MTLPNCRIKFNKYMGRIKETISGQNAISLDYKTKSGRNED